MLMKYIMESIDKRKERQITPEPPEVQLVADYINEFYKNKTVTNVAINDRNYFKKKIQLLKDKTLREVKRKGKYLIFEFDGDEKIICLNHLAMTGSWIERKFPKIPLHSRFALSFDRQTIDFVDMRKWGKFLVFKSQDFFDDEKIQKKLSSLGPDSLNNEVTLEYILHFVDKHRSKNDKTFNSEIKPLLLDQNFVSGLGNIYASEVCFLSNINPTKKLSELTIDEFEQLQTAIFPIVEQAYKSGGSSIRDYIHPDGTIGNAQHKHFVYNKRQCLMCKSDIIKIIQDKRSTFYCEKCQKK